MSGGRLWGEIERLAASGVDPVELGPSGYRSVARARLALTLLAAAAALLYPLAGAAALAAAAAAALLAATAPRVYRAVAGSALEREAPAVLAYLVPFSGTAAAIVDVLASLASRRGPPFRWASKEAERLSVRLRLSADPLSALEWLASTTPSKTLAAALRDYTAALRMGAPRAAVAQRLVDRAIDAARRAWSAYSSLARVATEAGAAMVVLAAALAPAAALASLDPAFIAAPLAAPPAAAIAIVLAQPSLGAPRSGLAPRLGPVAAAFAAASAIYAGLGAEAVMVLAALALLVEAYARVASRRFSQSWEALGRMIDKARLGLVDADDVSAASAAAPGVAEALAAAVRAAGGRGLTRTLEGLYRLIQEARLSYSATAGQAWVMAAVSVAAAALGVYALESLAGIVSGAELLADPGVLEAVGKALVAYAPLAPLPAAGVGGNWVPPLTPPLVAALVAPRVGG